MSMSKKVKLTIAGSEYVLTSDDSEEYLRSLGEQVDRQMKEVMESNSRLSVTMAAVLVALNNADEARKANDAADNLRQQMKGYLDDNARVRQEAEELRRENHDLRRRAGSPFGN